MTIVPVLALGTAFLSAVATISIRQGLRRSDPYTAVWINVIVGAVGMWIAVLATGNLARVSRTGLVIFVVAGLVGTVGGRILRLSVSDIKAPTAYPVDSTHASAPTV